jgi:hypothetical protein
MTVSRLVGSACELVTYRKKTNFPYKAAVYENT